MCAPTHYVDSGHRTLCGRSHNRRENLRISEAGPVLAITAVLCLAVTASAHAGDRLAWTGGVTEIEGSAGGGLVPWALIGGLETSDQIGGSAFSTYVPTGDFSLRTIGLNLGIRDRVEVSFARQRFDASSVMPELTLGQDIIGLKVKILGDAVFAPDRWLPQISAGAQYKKTLDFDGVPRAIGSLKGDDVDLYACATKVYFAAIDGHNLLLDATLRRTRADQFGLLGFGGSRHSNYSFTPEMSAAVWVTDDVLAGVEYRIKPNDLATFQEDNAYDVFLAWNPAKILTITAAFVDLGRIAGKSSQEGGYVSLWIGF
jgi:Protein of unknown function (DUF3034)